MASPRQLVFASLMADNAMPFYRALIAYLAASVGGSVSLLEEVPWQEAERRLYRGDAHLGAVCGLQYVRAVDAGLEPGVSVVAAPVMRARRYGGRPVYFSDVVVRAETSYASLGDLRGASWAYNEPTSHSGYGLVRYVLAARGELDGFFGRAVASGAHQRSLGLLLAGQVHATAMDSTVLEQVVRDAPWLASEIRVIETLGPSPTPPVVASNALDSEIIERIRTALLSMHADAVGRAVLDSGAVQQFVATEDSDYEPIRVMDRLAAQVKPWPVAEPVES